MFLVSRDVEALRAIDGWDAGRAAAGVARADGVVATHGRGDAELRWASVTKLLTGSLFSSRSRRGRSTSTSRPARPARRYATCSPTHPACRSTAPSRSPSRAGGASTRTRGSSSPRELLEERAEMPFADYFAQAVVRPLGLAGRLAGSPAYGYRGPLDDLLALGRELLEPTLVAAETLAEAMTVQFPGLTGVLPGLGRMEPNDWGLDVRAARREVAALDGLAQLRAHLRPLRRERHLPLGRSGRGPRLRRPHGPAVRRLGQGGVAGLSDAVLEELGPTVREVEPNGPWRSPGFGSIMRSNERARVASHRGRHRRDVARGLGRRRSGRARGVSRQARGLSAVRRGSRRGPAGGVARRDSRARRARRRRRALA